MISPKAGVTSGNENAARPATIASQVDDFPQVT